MKLVYAGNWFALGACIYGKKSPDEALKVLGLQIKPRNVINCIITLGDLLPDFNEPNYLDIGTYLGIVDWSKVAVDTPIKIRHNDGVVVNRHFSKFLGGMVYYFDNGRTSWSETGETKIMPKYVRLAGGDDEN